MKLCSTTVSFPEDLLFLRKYLGLFIDIGPAMIAKILTHTGKVVHHRLYQLFTHEELADPIEHNYMKAFLQIAVERWVNHLARGQLDPSPGGPPRYSGPTVIYS